MHCVRCHSDIESKSYQPEIQLHKGRIYCIPCSQYLAGMKKWKIENYERLVKVPGLKQMLMNLPV